MTPLSLLAGRTVVCFLIHVLKLAGKMTKKRKEKCIEKNGHAWIRTNVPQAVGLQENLLLETSQPPHMIYTLEQFTHIPITCTLQIKSARPLGLHYIAQPLDLH